MKSSKSPTEYRRDRAKQLREACIMDKSKGLCMVCNKPWPSDVLCFHHRDPSDKEFNLNQKAFRSYSKKRCLDEAVKCDIVCMNCHALEHRALHRGESLIGNEEAYRRYRDRCITSYESVADRHDGLTNQRGTKFSTTI